MSVAVLVCSNSDFGMTPVLARCSYSILDSNCGEVNAIPIFNNSRGWLEPSVASRNLMCVCVCVCVCVMVA